jgi:putative flippase GtrA
MSSADTRHRDGVDRALTAGRHLASPESGRVGQGVRFAIAGGVVAIVYVSTTTVLAQVFGAPFQLALAVGFAVGLCVHFTLQRVFVWVDRTEFVLAIHEQAGRYLLLAAAQYLLTAAATAVLPPLLGVSPQAVYLVTVVIVTATNFVVFRSRVFHRRADGP